MSNALFQNSFYIGNTFNWILYGVNLVLYIQTMYIYATSNSAHKSSPRFFMSFSTAMLILVTIFVVVQSVFGQEMWIVNADYPGGSAAYLATHAAVWYQTMGTTASVMLQLMSDGLLIYRCSVVWRGRMIIILPCCLWLLSLAFGILDIYVSGSPNADFFQGLAARINVTYISISISLNLLLTGLICGRIWYYARDMRKQFGPAFSQTYFSLAAIIIESALPYTLSGIAFVVSNGLHNDITILFLSLYAMFMCLSPQMLILRVASGRAWSAETRTGVVSTTMRFERRAHPTSMSTTIHLDDAGKSKSSQDEESGSKL